MQLQRQQIQTAKENMIEIKDKHPHLSFLPSIPSVFLSDDPKSAGSITYVYNNIRPPFWIACSRTRQRTSIATRVSRLWGGSCCVTCSTIIRGFYKKPMRVLVNNTCAIKSSYCTLTFSNEIVMSIYVCYRLLLWWWWIQARKSAGMSYSWFYLDFCCLWTI